MKSESSTVKYNIKYHKTDHKKWKYKLDEDFVIKLEVISFSEQVFENNYIKVDGTNILTIKKGYAWDGLTAFPDIKKWLPASLVHDTLLQLIYDLKVIDESSVELTHYEFGYMIKQVSSSGISMIMTLGLIIFHPIWHKLFGNKK